MSRFPRCLAAFMGVLAGPLRAQPDSVRVVVELVGLDGQLERNVRAVMTLAREAQDGKLLTRSIPHLYQRGEADIARALRPFGYYQPRVVKALEAGASRWTAHYVVDPGRAVQVRDVRIDLRGEGSERPEFRARIAGFPLHPGDTLHDQLYEAGKLQFLTMANDSGYLDADFDTAAVNVDLARGAADIRLRFYTGSRYRFGPVRFEQSILNEKLLRTRMTFRAGEFYRHDKLLELQNNLSEDPYFARVEVLPQREEARDLAVPIRVVLEPRPRWTTEYGGGYGTDTGPRGRATAMWRWLNPRGHYADDELLASLVEQRATTRYHIPAVLHSSGLLSLVAGFVRTSVNPQRQITPFGLTSRNYSIGAKLFRKRIGWRETFSLAYQRSNFEIGIDTARTTLLIPGASWERTRLDSRILPRTGLRTRLEVQGSQKGLLSTASFLQLRGSAKAVYGFARGLRILTRAEAGRTFTSAFHDLPPLLRFFTGGDETVRGYGFLSLGPRDSLGTILGGQALLVGSVELDYQVMPRWLIAGFTDAGNATDRLTLSGIKQSVGGGVRFVSPIGLIRLDVAMAMGPLPGKSRIRFHLTMGPDL